MQHPTSISLNSTLCPVLARQQPLVEAVLLPDISRANFTKGNEDRAAEGQIQKKTIGVTVKATVKLKSRPLSSHGRTQKGA